MTQILEGLDDHTSIIYDMLIHGKTQKSMMKECERYSKSLMEEVQPLTRKSVNF